MRLTLCLLSGIYLSSHAQTAGFRHVTVGRVLVKRPEFSLLKWRPTDEMQLPAARKVFTSVKYSLFVGAKDFDKNNNTKLVMVSASDRTVTGREIQAYPSVVAIFTEPNAYFDQVLVDVSNDDDRDQIAKLAHAEVGACGALIPVNLNAQLIEPSKAFSAIWDTAAKLATVETNASQISSVNIRDTISSLEALGSRYHKGATGTAAVAAVDALWQKVAPTGSSQTQVSHTDSTQKSIVLSLPGTSRNEETVIIGAHLDSINLSDNTNAPGADDDASGVATLTEILRVIKANGLTFSRRIEFHAYGAEEVGLIGSTTIANSYASAGRKVAGMLQLDMNGYAKPENQNLIYLVTTNTSSVLRRQLKDLMGTYRLGVPIEMPLTGGTSDHRAWTNAGFHAVFPFEHPTAYNKSIHSSSDTAKLLDPALSAHFGKLSLAWLLHVAGVSAPEAAHSALVTALKTPGRLTAGTVKGSSSGERFIVSGPEDAKSGTVCGISAATDGSCIDAPRDLALGTVRSGRSFFYETADQTFTAAGLHRIVLYDAAGTAVAARVVSLAASPLAGPH